MTVRRPYPKEVEEFLVNNYQELTTDKLIEGVRTIDPSREYTEARVYQWLKSRKMHPKKKDLRHLMTIEQEEYFREVIPNRCTREVADMMNAKFGTSFTHIQLAHFKKNRKIVSGFDAKIKKGDNRPVHISPLFLERGAKYRFQKGRPDPMNVPHPRQPVGTVIERKGGMWIKIAEPRTWKQYSRYIWEKEFGEIPKGMIVSFKDSDYRNCSKENLMLISRLENALLNKCGMRSTSPEITQAKLATLRVVHKIKERQREQPDSISQQAAYRDLL